MRLRKIKIQNFRKLNDVEINLGDATFLIGANNAGKSSTLDVIEYLVTDKKLDNSCRSRYLEDGEELTKTEDVIIAENGGYPPTQNRDIRSLFWLFSLMALQN